MNIFALWPSQRNKRIESSKTEHELMDGLSYLEQFGHKIKIVDTFNYPYNIFAKSGSLWAGIDFLRFIVLLINIKKFEALISIGESSVLLFAIFCKLFGIPKKIIIIDPALGDDYPKRKQLQSIVFKCSDAIVVYGSCQLDYIKHNFDGLNNYYYVPHRIDTKFFSSAKARQTYSGKKYILSVGNDYGRDYETLLSAVKCLNIHTIIVTKHKISIIDNMTVIDKWISYEELRDLYFNAELIVVPLIDKIHAGGINGLLEAMAMGKAIITSKSQGLIDYTINNYNCLLVEPSNVEQLTNAINKLLYDSFLCQELGSNAKEFSEKKCSLEVYSKKINEILINL